MSNFESWRRSLYLNSSYATVPLSHSTRQHMLPFQVYPLFSIQPLLYTMKAFQFLGVEQGLLLRDVPVPTPRANQALIKVKAAGLCHSDNHVLHGGGAAWMCALPIILGHEVAGVIVELGPNESSAVPPLKVGDRVAVACVGHPIQERNFQEALGVGCDGGYAEYAVAPIKNLVKIPNNVDFP